MNGRMPLGINIQTVVSGSLVMGDAFGEIFQQCMSLRFERSDIINILFGSIFIKSQFRNRTPSLIESQAI